MVNSYPEKQINSKINEIKIRNFEPHSKKAFDKKTTIIQTQSFILFAYR